MSIRIGTVNVDAEEVIPYSVPMFVFQDLDGNRLIVVEQTRPDQLPLFALPARR